MTAANPVAAAAAAAGAVPAPLPAPAAPPPLGIPEAAYEWLAAVDVPAVSRVPAVKKLGKSTWAVNDALRVVAAMQASPQPDRRALGDKLLLLFPRLLLWPVYGVSGHKRQREFRRRAQLFVAGGWEQLWNDMPPPLTAADRAARQRDRDTKRGYATDVQLDLAVKRVAEGQPGKARAALTTSGIYDDAARSLAFLEGVHFPAPTAPAPVDPAAITEGEVAGVAAASLTAEEQDVYDTAARTPLSDDTKAQLAIKLRELIPTLELRDF